MPITTGPITTRPLADQKSGSPGLPTSPARSSPVSGFTAGEAGRWQAAAILRELHPRSGHRECVFPLDAPEPPHAWGSDRCGARGKPCGFYEVNKRSTAVARVIEYQPGHTVQDAIPRRAPPDGGCFDKLKAATNASGFAPRGRSGVGHAVARRSVRALDLRNLLDMTPEPIMRIVTYSHARNALKSVLDTVVQDADVTIISRRDAEGDAVVMSLDTYNSMMETLYLTANPANAAHLARSIAELRAGKAKRRELARD